MLRKGHYRQVFEMGQEGQEKTESVSDVRGLKNFLKFGAPNTPKGTRGRRFQEVLIVMFQKSVQNFVPFVPVRGFWAYRAYRIVTFPCGGGIVKVTILYAKPYSCQGDLRVASNTLSNTLRGSNSPGDANRDDTHGTDPPDFRPRRTP